MQMEEQKKKHQEQEYVVPGQSSSANIKVRFSQNERKSIQGLYSECLGICVWNLGYESGGYGKIGENGTNDVQVDVWCSLKE